jgi:1-acyl-sn-glycerol-3-phosphate acyltransferase
MAADHIPPPPEQAPQIDNRFSRWLGRKLLRLMGWSMTGEFPSEPKLVLAVAPHTSNWDFFIGFAALMASGLRVSWLMKQEAFIWPFKGFLMSWGGIPVNRKAARDTVEQIHAWYNEHEKVWVVLTPEGTRSRVPRWKTGFLRIAYAAKVPVLLVAFDYPSKTLVLDRCWPLSGDIDADEAAMRGYINEHYRGRNPEGQ